MLSVDWQSFGEAIRAQAVIEAEHITATGKRLGLSHARMVNAAQGKPEHITATGKRLGLSHARMVNAAQGKPVGTEIFLTLCHWLQCDPMHYARQHLEHKDSQNG